MAGRVTFTPTIMDDDRTTQVELPALEYCSCHGLSNMSWAGGSDRICPNLESRNVFRPKSNVSRYDSEAIGIRCPPTEFQTDSTQPAQRQNKSPRHFVLPQRDFDYEPATRNHDSDASTALFFQNKSKNAKTPLSPLFKEIDAVDDYDIDLSSPFDTTTRSLRYASPAIAPFPAFKKSMPPNNKLKLEQIYKAHDKAGIPQHLAMPPNKLPGYLAYHPSARDTDCEADAEPAAPNYGTVLFTPLTPEAHSTHKHVTAPSSPKIASIEATNTRAVQLPGPGDKVGCTCLSCRDFALPPAPSAIQEYFRKCIEAGGPRIPLPSCVEFPGKTISRGWIRDRMRPDYAANDPVGNEQDGVLTEWMQVEREKYEIVRKEVFGR